MDTLRILGSIEALRMMRRWLMIGPDDRVRLRLCPIRHGARRGAAGRPDPHAAEKPRLAVLVE